MVNTSGWYLSMESILKSAAFLNRPRGVLWPSVLLSTLLLAASVILGVALFLNVCCVLSSSVLFSLLIPLDFLVCLWGGHWGLLI